MNKMFPKLLLGAAILCSILLFIDCNTVSQEGTRHAQAMRGKEIFAEQCMSCHGMDDLPATKTDLEEKAPDLTQIIKRRKKSEFPVAEIARIIDGRLIVKGHGPREMPVWGEVYDSLGMDKESIRGRKGELVAYLMSIQE
ncbi:MAG: cytochrome c [Saprospiraceae bacterium]|nr:cytochrome c [Saprospiraceae bacterium]